MGARLRSLNTPDRRAWWVSFAILFALGALWALANPPTAASDELAHVVHAAAVSRGDFFGRPLSREQLAEFPSRYYVGSNQGGDPRVYRSVKVPEIYDRPNLVCYVNHSQQTAACLDFAGPQAVKGVVSQTTRYPPAFYAWVGFPARLVSAGPPALYVMRLAAVGLVAALVASAVVTLRRVGDSSFVRLGLLVALTPVALFFGATVNPTGVEVAAAIGLWVSGTVVVNEARSSGNGGLDARLVARVGIAAGVLVLTRQLGPLWVGLTVLVLAGLAGMQGLRALRRSRALVAWTCVVAACLVAQLAWIVWVRALDPHNFLGVASHKDGLTLAKESFGDSYSYLREMIGVFGWRDVPAPTLTFLIWFAALGGLGALAVAFGRRRDVVALLVVTIATVVVPVALYVEQAGYAGWQGRYGMPVAVGVPVLAGLALRDTAVLNARGVAVAVAGAALGVGHVLAFAQNLRRYSVGAGGTVWFWTREAWSPPVASLLLLIAFVVVTAGWVAWLLSPSRAHRRAEQLETGAARLELLEAKS
ncbi:MAG TPA: DUF2142 domain-containing protein, partial [Acidimicrobiia bacterium]|nr:DUF2142 domain-containing protein [Acidimicrobiia bacterium]